MSGRPGRPLLSRRAASVFAAMTCAFVLLPGASGHGGGGPTDFYDYDLDQSAPLAGFDTLEIDFKVRAGRTVQWEVQTAEETPLYFDLHGHAPNGTTVSVVLVNMTAHESGVLVPENATLYSLIAVRDGFDRATIQVVLSGNLAITATKNFAVEYKIPSGAALAVVSCAILALAGVRRRTIQPTT